MSVDANYTDHANIFLGQKMSQMFVLYPALLVALLWKAGLSKVAMNQQYVGMAGKMYTDRS